MEVTEKFASAKLPMEYDDECKIFLEYLFNKFDEIHTKNILIGFCKNTIIKLLDSINANGSVHRDFNCAIDDLENNRECIANVTEVMKKKLEIFMQEHFGKHPVNHRVANYFE